MPNRPLKIGCGMLYTSIMLATAVFGIYKVTPVLKQWNHSYQERKKDDKPLHYQYDVATTDFAKPTSEAGPRNNPTSFSFFGLFSAKDDHNGLDNAPRLGSREQENISSNHALYAVCEGKVPKGGYQSSSSGGHMLTYICRTERDIHYQEGIIPGGYLVMGDNVVTFDNKQSKVEKEEKKKRAATDIRYFGGKLERGTLLAITTMHLSQPLAKDGDEVKPQQHGGLPLGVIGNTGVRSRGIHAHTEVYVVDDESNLRRLETNITYLSEVTNPILTPTDLERQVVKDMLNSKCDFIGEGTLDNVIQDEAKKEYRFALKYLTGGCEFSPETEVSFVYTEHPFSSAKKGQVYVLSLRMQKNPRTDNYYVIEHIGYVSEKAKKIAGGSGGVKKGGVKGFLGKFLR